MKLHLVGGFLGSGKTTAIIQAARVLMDWGLTVGVITNDQGKYLVDTAFFRLADLPAVEVTGGCFCCNYDDLNDRLLQLIEAVQPDVIFAESVGSCADIVATVVKPLLELGGEAVRPASFTVFADVRLLRRRLLGQELPFSEDVVYIFDQQIEEAGLIIVNKIDLLSITAVEQIRALMEAHYPGRPVILQSSLTASGVQPWVDLIQGDRTVLPGATLDIDYERYGAGEAQLAWLDQVVTLAIPAGQPGALRSLITSIVGKLATRGAGIGHLKFIIQELERTSKLSIPTVEEPGWEQRIPQLEGMDVTLLVNARVELPAAELRAVVQHALDESRLPYSIQNADAFHPNPPRPTHRLA